MRTVPLMERINPHSAAIGAAVRGAIASAGLSQAEAAEASSISLNSFSRRINGLLPFTWPEIVTVADVTGTTVLELVKVAERLAAKDAA